MGVKNDNSAGLSVVIPTYNSVEFLHELVDRIEPVLTASGERFELVLVNDGSIDRTWEVIEQLRGARPWLRSIDLARNCGQHNALLCGLRAAKYRVIVTLDDDLQNPPEEIPKLLAALDDEVDVASFLAAEFRPGPASSWFGVSKGGSSGS